MFSQISANQQMILDQIDLWGDLIATSLRRATASTHRAAEVIIEEAEQRFGELSEEIVDCLAYE